MGSDLDCREDAHRLLCTRCPGSSSAIARHLYRGRSQELGGGEPRARVPCSGRQQSRTEPKVGLSGTRHQPCALKPRGWNRSEGLAPLARAALQWLSSPSTWPCPAERLSLLFWRQSYIFNDLQSLPVRREGEVKLKPSNLHCESSYPPSCSPRICRNKCLLMSPGG